MPRLTIKQDPEKEVPTEILADAIVSIADGLKKLRAGRLKDDTLCMLIAHASPAYGKYPRKKVGSRDVKAMLEGIASLEAIYLKPKRP